VFIFLLRFLRVRFKKIVQSKLLFLLSQIEYKFFSLVFITSIKKIVTLRRLVGNEKKLELVFFKG